jgi:hypothetical protein
MQFKVLHLCARAAREAIYAHKLCAILFDNVYITGGDVIGTASATLSFPFPNAFLASSGVRCQLYANAGEHIRYFWCSHSLCCYILSSHTLYTISYACTIRAVINGVSEACEQSLYDAQVYTSQCLAKVLRFCRGACSSSNATAAPRITQVFYQCC